MPFVALGDKWQSKTLFLTIFDPHSSIVKGVSNCHLSGVIIQHENKTSMKKVSPDSTEQLEDLKVLRRSPDLLNNVKIGQE